MPPFQPYIGLSRSQSLRIGRGPGNHMVSEMTLNDTGDNEQTGALNTLLYADLGDNFVRRDVQHHSAIGAIDSVGTASLTTYSDLFAVQGLAVSNGSGFALSVSAGQIQSRFYGTQLAVAAQTVTPAAPPAFGGRTDYVVVNPAGVVSVITGPTDTVAPTYEVWAVTIGGSVAPTGGTFTLQFTYNNFLYTTPTIAYSAAGTAVATGILGATGGPANATFKQATGNANSAVVGSGTALPTGPATLTFGGGAEGPVVPVFGNPTALTGGTGNVINVTRSTVGSGAPAEFPSGNVLVLANVYIPSTATSNSNYLTDTSVVLTS